MSCDEGVSQARLQMEVASAVEVQTYIGEMLNFDVRYIVRVVRVAINRLWFGLFVRPFDASSRGLIEDGGIGRRPIHWNGRHHCGSLRGFGSELEGAVTQSGSV